MASLIGVQRASLLALAAFAGGLVAGCGSGTTNLAPEAATKPVTGVPSSPTLGYVFSPSDGTLRAIIGVRGSSQMSASIVPAGVYVAGDTSTASGAALLEDASGSLFAFNLPLSQPVHVADGLPAHAQVVFSPAGQFAIVYAAGGTSVTVVSGLPASPQVQVRPVTNNMLAAVVSDAGNVAMMTQGSPSTVGALSATGVFTRAATLTAAGGMNFLPGTDSLMLTDSGANTAAIVRTFSTTPVSVALNVAGAGGGLNQPIAIAGSTTGNWAVIADGGDQNLFRVDLTGATPAVKLSCTCQTSALNPLRGGTGFRLNTLYGGPVWTLDTSSATPQLLFVPAIAKGTP